MHKTFGWKLFGFFIAVIIGIISSILILVILPLFRIKNMLGEKIHFLPVPHLSKWGTPESMAQTQVIGPADSFLKEELELIHPTPNGTEIEVKFKVKYCLFAGCKKSLIII